MVAFDAEVALGGGKFAGVNGNHAAALDAGVPRDLAASAEPHRWVVSHLAQGEGLSMQRVRVTFDGIGQGITGLGHPVR